MEVSCSLLIEYLSTFQQQSSIKKASTDKLVATDLICQKTSFAAQAVQKSEIFTQTEELVKSATLNNEKLAIFLRKIYPLLEAELDDGPTFNDVLPFFDNSSGSSLKIESFQKLNATAGWEDNSHGAAIWLSVYMNDVLVTSSASSDRVWCQHMEETVQIYLPKRVKGGTSATSFHKEDVVQVEGCVRTLSTNPFRKNIFAGGTTTGDLYVWEFRSLKEKAELFKVSKKLTEEGPIIAIDWMSINLILTCHSNGTINQWKVSETDIKDKLSLSCVNMFNIQGHSGELRSNFVTVLIAISDKDFIAGTKSGKLFHCGTENTSGDPVINEDETHIFEIIFLSKSKLHEMDVVVSADLSGEIHFNDVKHFKDGPISVLKLKLPSPFKTSLGCASNPEHLLLCSGPNASLEVIRMENGDHIASEQCISSNAQIKGNIVASSCSGFIVIGSYGGNFQIFKLKND